MIGAKNGNLRGVSGAGGSCFYRAVAYQLCERERRPYHDTAEVERLRSRVREYLQQHARDPVPNDPQLKWQDLGGYPAGYAEAPVPQAMPSVVQCPLTVYLNGESILYGKELPGEPLGVRLSGEHYVIQYGIRL